MKKIKYITLLLLTLFVGKLVSDTLLTHTHTYEWGTVTHSHPYSQKGHTHSTDDLVLIANLNSTPYTTPDTTSVIIAAESEISINWYYAEDLVSTTISARNQRAPPLLG